MPSDGDAARACAVAVQALSIRQARRLHGLNYALPPVL